MQGRIRASALCGMIAGPLLLGVSWVATLAQPDDFDFMEHATSDLGADTSDAAWFTNPIGSLVGLLVLAFAVGLWHMLGRHRSARLGSMLVGTVGLGLFLTSVFNLDCRELDDCDNTSWQATAHLVVAGVTGLTFLVAPFVVARALRFAEGWQDLRAPSLVFGVLAVVAGIGASAVGAGLGSYALAIVWFAWITTIALRMLRLAKDRPATKTA